jgi:hypothetical protein
MYWSSVFSVLALLAALPLPLASPTVPRWDDMSEKHSWASVPQKWEPYDTPPASSTINLHIALKPRRENALIDALYEVSDPDHPRCISLLLPPMFYLLIYVCKRCHVDMACTCPKSKSLSSSHLTPRRSKVSTPGLHIMGFPPLRSPSCMAGAGSQSLASLLPKQIPYSTHHTNSIATQRRTRLSFERFAMHFLLISTTTSRMWHRRRISAHHTLSGKRQEWCSMAQSFPTTTWGCEVYPCRQYYPVAPNPSSISRTPP